jgi:O-antigen/teichoic acid export membrane protein
MRQLVRLLGQNILLVALSFIVGILTARALPPSDRGTVALCQTIALFTANVVPWGTHIYLSRLAATPAYPAKVIYAFVYRYIALIALIGFGAAWLAVSAFQIWGSLQSSASLTIIAALIVPLSVTNAYQTQIELGRANITGFGMLRLITSVVQIVLLAAIFLLDSASPQLVLGIFCVAVFTSCALGAALIRHGAPESEATPEPLHAWETLRHSGKYGLAVVSSALLQHADKILVGLFFSPFNVGIYFVAAGLAQVIHIAGDAFTQSMYIRAVGSQAGTGQDWQSISGRLRMTTLVYISIALPSIAVLATILPLVYGESYRAGAWLMIALVPAALAFSLNRNCEELIKGLGGTVLTLNLSLLPVIFLAVIFSLLGDSTNLAQFCWLVFLSYMVGLCAYAVALRRMSGLSIHHFFLCKPEDIRMLFVAIRTIALRGRPIPEKQPRG